jgi:hypothetical protein
MASSARLVIRLATRSAASGGTAHTGSSNSHGDTEASSTSKVTIRASVEALLSSWRGAAAS